MNNSSTAVGGIQELNLLRVLSGQWAGTVAAGSMSGALEIALSRDSGVWAAGVKMDMGGRQASNQAGDLKVSETELSFTMEFASANVRFVGKADGEIISGALEATVGGRVVGSGSWKVKRISPPRPTPEKTSAADSTNSGPARVIGEVTEIDRAALRLSVKLDAGETLAVKLDSVTSYLRVSPEESSLKKAAPISLAEVAVGDRVYARGQKTDDKTAFSARQLIVMTRTDLARKQERERMAWRQRSVVGAITALNPNTKEIALLMRTPDPEEAIERMPAFTLSELKPGDRVIVSCVRNATPARVMAIGLFTGVDPLFKLLQEQLAQQRGGAASNLSLGLPMGVL